MSESQVLFVTRGRTVMIDGTANGPGAMVTLPYDDAAFLTSRGFLQAEMPSLPVPATAPNPAAIGLQGPSGVQGPVFR